jgi:hypothetical protein
VETVSEGKLHRVQKEHVLLLPLFPFRTEVDEARCQDGYGAGERKVELAAP